MKDWFVRLLPKSWSGYEDSSPDAWQRIGHVRVENASGRNEIALDLVNDFRLVKLRSRFVDMQVSRWTVEFENGAIQDLSVGWLLRGTECRPVAIAGRRLKGMAVEYRAGAGARGGRLEVFAQR